MTLRAIARTNLVGTCVYCGQRLAAWRNLGPHFCTGGCAENFGLAAARLGFRLKPYTDPDAATVNAKPKRRRPLPTDVCQLCDRPRSNHEGERHVFSRRDA